MITIIHTRKILSVTNAEQLILIQFVLQLVVIMTITQDHENHWVS